MPGDTKGMTRVVCTAHLHDEIHHFTPTAMALLLTAIQEGDGHTIAGTVFPICLVDVLENIGMDDPRRTLYRGAIDYRR